MIFTDEEKKRLFDKIEELYFHRNFGSTTKSDLETLLFSEYIDCRINHGLSCDDYTLSKKLGITQSRVRSLKERKELKYPTNTDENWWRIEFAEAAQNAKYDEQDHCIKFIIQDINVMTETRHYIETRGWYDEISLNRKLLKIPFDCFAEICLEDESLTELFSEKNRKEVERICKATSGGYGLRMLTDDFSMDGFKRFLMAASKEAIGLALNALPFGGVAKIAFSAIGNVISDM